MRIVGLDPGCHQTAWTIYAGGKPVEFGKVENRRILELLKAGEKFKHGDDLLAIEMIASYGMAVGKEVFDTCLYVGRFLEAWEDRGGKARLVFRKEVKLHFCETTRATDSNIRASMIDRFGPGKEAAIGTKKAPGPLYGIKGDEWSALAVAITAEAAVKPELSAKPISEAARRAGQPF